jgi:hypothetical protein
MRIKDIKFELFLENIFVIICAILRKVILLAIILFLFIKFKASLDITLKRFQAKCIFICVIKLHKTPLTDINDIQF